MTEGIKVEISKEVLLKALGQEPKVEPKVVLPVINSTILIELTGDDLREHFLRLGRLHAAKAQEYANKRREIDSQIIKMKQQGERMQAVTNNPIYSLEQTANSMEQSQKQHEEKQLYYTFLADYIPKDELYRLSEAEIIRLGILQKFL